MILLIPTSWHAGEDDIEEILKSIESEEKKRTEVKIKTVDPPSQR